MILLSIYHRVLGPRYFIIPGNQVHDSAAQTVPSLFNKIVFFPRSTLPNPGLLKSYTAPTTWGHWKNGDSVSVGPGEPWKLTFPTRSLLKWWTTSILRVARIDRSMFPGGRADKFFHYVTSATLYPLHQTVTKLFRTDSPVLLQTYSWRVWYLTGAQ